VSALNSFITSGYKEKLMLLPGYADTAMGIEKLGLPSVKIPDLFLAEKISAFPSPPTSPPPPGLTHPSSPGFVRPTVIPQSVRENVFAPIRRGSDPGTFNRTVIEGVASYKSAVQGRLFGGGDGYIKSAMNPTKESPTPPPSETDGAVVGGPQRRINPKIVS
jgi:hypothetical protein